MARRLVWVGCDNSQWPLTGYGVRGVFLEYEGHSGLAGGVEASPQALVGTTVKSTDGVASPMEIPLNLVVASHTAKWGAHGSVSALAQRFAKGCSPIDPGRLIVERGDGPRWELPATAVFPGLPSPNMVDGAQRFQLALSSPDGLWRSAYSSKEPSVTVTNSGDATTYPTIVWKGAGGRVTLPSGAKFTLPQTQQPRMVRLDPAESTEICFPNGQADPAMRTLLWGTPVEGVPRKQTKKFLIPQGAELHWEIYSYTPWV